jgi:hypothetical protein
MGASPGDACDAAHGELATYYAPAVFSEGELAALTHRLYRGASRAAGSLCPVPAVPAGSVTTE